MPRRPLARLLALTGLLVVSALAILAACGSGSEPANTSPTSTAEPASEPTASTMSASDNSRLGTAELLPGEPVIEGVVAYAISEAKHVDHDVEYDTSPPVGGSHYGGWQNCGFYTVELRNEQAVHSIEHGAVWITYRSDAAADDLASLERLAERNTHILVSPYPQQPTELVMSAWGRQLMLSSVSDPRFMEFLETYLGEGPTTPEPGAVCFGAIGVPPDQPMLVPER